VMSRPTVSRVSKWALLDISCRGLKDGLLLHAPNHTLIKDYSVRSFLRAS
jgi:hypothetical protein